MTEGNDLLTEYARAWREQQPAVHVDFAAATSDATRRRLTAPLTFLAAVAVVAVIAIVASLIAGVGSSRGARITPGDTTTPSKPRVKEIIDLQQRRPVAVSATPQQVAVLELDGVSVLLERWSTGSGGQPARVITPSLTNLLSEGGPTGMVAGARALYIVTQPGPQSGGHIYRIDAATLTVSAPLSVGFGARAALTNPALWVVDADGQLLRVDPRTMRVVARAMVPSRGSSPKFISAGHLGVWIADPDDGSVFRLDADGQIVRKVADVGSFAGPLTQLDGQIWVTTADGVAAIDATTGRVTRRVALPLRAVAIATDGHDVWAATDGARLYRIKATDGVVSAVPIPNAGPIVAIVGEPTHREIWVITEGTQAAVQLCDHDCPKLLRVRG